MTSTTHFELVGGLFVRSKPTATIRRDPAELARAPRADAELTVQLQVTAPSEGLTAELRVLNPEGTEVWATRHPISTQKFTTVTGSIEDAELWEPPAGSDVFAVLYKLEATLLQGHEVVDDATATFGIREVVMSPSQGLIINGKHHKVQGVCNHQVRFTPFPQPPSPPPNPHACA